MFSFAEASKKRNAKSAAILFPCCGETTLWCCISHLLATKTTMTSSHACLRTCWTHSVQSLNDCSFVTSYMRINPCEPLEGNKIAILMTLRGIHLRFTSWVYLYLRGYDLDWNSDKFWLKTDLLEWKYLRKMINYNVYQKWSLENSCRIPISYKIKYQYIYEKF